MSQANDSLGLTTEQMEEFRRFYDVVEVLDKRDWLRHFGTDPAKRFTESEIKYLIAPLCRYVFLDVVEFSRRDTLSQVNIVTTLNIVVRVAVSKALSIPIDAQPNTPIIYLPTGDGICIVFLDPLTPYDLPIRTALEILALVRLTDKYVDTQLAPGQQDRKFDVRIGLEQNHDTLVVDVNGNLNVAGEGINKAQRIMDQAGKGQICLSQNVYNALQPYHPYRGFFANYRRPIKGGQRISVYQFNREGYSGLNIDPLQPRTKQRATNGRPVADEATGQG